MSDEKVIASAVLRFVSPRVQDAKERADFFPSRYQADASNWRHSAVRELPDEMLAATIDTKLYQLRGNARPYFSTTATVRWRGGAESGGCCHGDILRVCPALAPLVALHLSDDEGAPMHAEANGFFYLMGAIGYPLEHGPRDNAEKCREYFASHMRLHPVEAESIYAKFLPFVEKYNRGRAERAAQWAAEYGPPVKPARDWSNEAQFILRDSALVATMHAEFAPIVAGMRPRWQREALAGLAMLTTKPVTL